MAQNKFLTIDTDKLKNKFAINIQKQADKVGKKIIKTASNALFEHIKEQADQKLNTRKQFYKNNLQLKETSDNGYKIILRKPAQWIENGLSAQDLKQTMLNKGQTTRVIPLSEVVLVGTNKAKKVAPASAVRFRTISVNSPASSWQTAAIKGVQLFKEAKTWFASQLKAGKWSKK